MQWRDQSVHLMGIGGAGMSALVPLLQLEGANCSGCDLVRSPVVEQCEKNNVQVHLGHDLSHLQNVDIVVYSSAVPKQHEELREARLRGLQVISRASCLAELMRGRKTIAVAGSHGKTTTTWMLGHLLNSDQLDPVIMCGGSLDSLNGVGGQAGKGSLFVAEVDESDGGFLHVDPSIAIITNLEAEHVRHYGSFEALCQAVHDWLADIDESGYIIIADGSIEPVLHDCTAPIIRCGIGSGDYTATHIELEAEGSTCTVCYRGEELARVHIPIPGLHNIKNALCAIAAARCINPDIDVCSLNNCERVDRRFSVRAQVSGIRIVEDYGHHPTEIIATIEAAQLGAERVHVIFQPHRYSRTADLYTEFTSAFTAAHAVAIVPIYAAHEEALPGINARYLVEGIAAYQRQHDGHGERIQYAAHFDEAVGFILSHAQDGDTILVLGAGDVDQVVPMLEESLAC